MKYFYKKAILILVILFFITQHASAQRKYFMYIQAENKQPFYISVNNKIYSSSLTGNLVIPRLKNGKYFFIAGFPKNKYSEQKFSYVINDKDVGFVLKQFGNEGWGLFNIIDFTKIMANSENWESDKMQNDTTTIDDTYTISPIIKTQEKTSTTVKEEHPQKTETTTTQKEEISSSTATNQTKETNTKENKKAESTTTTSQQENKETSSTKTVVATNNKKGIIRTYQKANINGIDEMYVDYTTTPTDTIIVFIPQQVEQSYTNSKTNTTEDTTTYTTSNKNNITNTGQYNTSCVNLATEADILRVRKLMSAETTDEKMIQVAKKNFGNKCLYVEQIQKLGLLFLSEQSRLKFFSVIYPSIYDKFNYASLEMQFTLSSVINQFRQSL